MYSRNRFQYETATGRGTLPAVFFISLILWLIPSIGDWEQLGSFLCASACAYLLQETDTRFALIRTRTTLPSALFLLGYASCTFLHGWSASCLLPVCFIGILYSLFHSYESPYASTTIFHAFLWLGIAGLIVPTFCWLAPFMYIYMINLRSFSARSFFAGIIGLFLPLWFLFCYQLYIGEGSRILPKLAEMVTFAPIRYDQGVEVWVSWGITLILSVIYGVVYLQDSYKDKVQTRIMMRCVLLMGLCIHLIMLVQPHLVPDLLPVALIPAALAGGHLFALSFKRFTYWLFVATLAVIGLLFVFNLWMHLFNC